MPNGLTDEIINILISIVDDTNFNLTQVAQKRLSNGRLSHSDTLGPICKWQKGPFRGPFRVGRSVIVIELEVQIIDTSVIDFLESRSLSEIISLKMICQI